MCSSDLRRQVHQLIQNVTENTAKTHRCTVAFGTQNKINLYPVINDSAVANQVMTRMITLYGQEVVGDCDRWYASESYGKYLEKYKGALGFLGIRNEALGTGAVHHNGKFDIDEEVMVLGASAEGVFALGAER